MATEEWSAVLDALGEEMSITILLGATETEKSAPATFLITRLCRKGIKTAFVDAHIGQSFLGPPTTIGLTVFESSPDWENPPEPEIFFVGSTSPEGNFPLHLGGVKKMVDQALSHDAQIIVVVGLLDLNGDTLAFGVIKHYVEEIGVLRILTPLKETEKVRPLQLRSLKLLPSSEDERF